MSNHGNRERTKSRTNPLNRRNMLLGGMCGRCRNNKKLTEILSLTRKNEMSAVSFGRRDSARM